jgi:hypothetical protein
MKNPTVFIPPSGLGVGCRCGYLGDSEEFFHSPMGLELPKGHFQCPKCGWAFTRGPVEKDRWGIIGDHRIVEVEALL